MQNTNFQKTNVYSPPVEKVVEKIVYVERPSDKPVLIEFNDKRFKALIIISNLIGGLGFAIFVFTFTDTGMKLMSHETGFGIGILFAAISVIVYAVARFLMWWNNG